MNNNLFQPLYPAKIWPADGVFYVQFIDLDNGFTFGEIWAEAKEMASDVLSALLSSALEHNEPIPLPSSGIKDSYLIAPEVKVQVAWLLRVARLQQSQPGEAKPLNRNPTLNQLQKTLKALGKELVLELREVN
jgi:predicted RNase H-like HicB family nuclease